MKISILPLSIIYLNNTNDMNAILCDIQEPEYQLFESSSAKKSLLDSSNDEVLGAVNKILDNAWYKVEPIRDGNGNEIAAEMLAVFKGVFTPDALDILKEANKTFDLFKKMLFYSFEEAKNHNRNPSINLFLKDFSNPNLIPEIERLNSNYSFNNSKIIFEILEFDHGTLNKVAINNIKTLKSKGFKIAIDDFIPHIEDDNKSLENLQILIENKITPDIVKIEGKFLGCVINGEASGEETQILRNLINFLKEKGVKIVGEWIKNSDEGRKAKMFGIDLFQGMYLTDSFSIKKKERKKTNIKDLPGLNNLLKNFITYTNTSVQEIVNRRLNENL